MDGTTLYLPPGDPSSPPAKINEAPPAPLDVAASEIKPTVAHAAAAPGPTSMANVSNGDKAPEIQSSVLSPEQEVRVRKKMRFIVTQYHDERKRRYDTCKS